MENRDKRSSDAIDGMLIMVRWREMNVFCINRESCAGCPYKENGICTKYSTQEVMELCADIFQGFIED